MSIMSSQVSAASILIQDDDQQNSNRHSANYHPTLWGDHFLAYANDSMTIDPATREEYKELKQEIRRLITPNIDQLVKKLYLIDTVQRLGVAYLFAKEIEDELEKIHNLLYIESDDDHDLYTVSLAFRLLRQQGIKISCGVFEKFKDEESKFKATLISDVQGLLSLYEAAHLAIPGEDILDEAITFATTHLKGHVASGIECYTKQHGVSEEDVVNVFRKEVENAWKDMNQELLKPTAFPMPLMERVLNLARVIDYLYKDSDSYTNAHLVKDQVASLLRDPLPL
ncbi:Valencene synthase [Melia azedarach]|uniref:Valencene synthase n=1 Tax=Melia azedarach TaxID=155640 RepID=A0ACC1Y6H2_MELAZ|nr:Valencene synthase [Melia azedarach]